MVHIAVVGTGRVGGEVAFTLLFERYVTRLTLIDTAPQLAETTREELCHAIACHEFNVEMVAYNNSKRLQNAELIIVAAGFPRTPEMSRRDLAARNAQIVKEIVEDTIDRNPRAWYFIITNPADAMATLANRVVQGKNTVIGTGTNLETSRFRTILARELSVPVRMIEGFVGGEHGEEAVLLWSTVRIDGQPLNEYLTETGKTIDKSICEDYVKEVSRQIIRVCGGTRHGPAGSFIEIIRGIVLDTNTVTSFSKPRKFKRIPEAMYVTVPGKIGRSLESDIWNSLAEDEKEAIEHSAMAIYKTFCEAKQAVGMD